MRTIADAIITIDRALILPRLCRGFFFFRKLRCVIKMTMSILAAYLLPHQSYLLLRQKDGTGEKTLLAYKAIGNEIARFHPETIVIVSPHMESYRDYMQIADGEIGTGQLHFEGRGDYKFRLVYDRPLAKEIAMVCSSSSFPAGMEGEREGFLDHGTMVPLFFINRAYSSFKVVRIGVSGLSLRDHYRLGELLASSIESLGRRAVLIASGDLSHSHEIDGHEKDADLYETRLLSSLKKGNFGALLNFSRRELKASEECSHRPLTVLAGAFDRENVEVSLLSKEIVSGVGVATGSFYPRGSNPSRAFLELYEAKEKIRIAGKRGAADHAARLAYRAIEYYLKTNSRLPLPSGLPPAFYRRSGGVFVSLYCYGSPRGCLGTCFARESNLGNEIISNAIAVVTSDPRYSDLTIDEFPFVEVRVDVLSRPERIAGIESLNPAKYGLIVESGDEKRGVLLPRLEGVESPEEQLEIAYRKARIEPSEEPSLFRFTTVSHQ